MKISNYWSILLSAKLDDHQVILSDTVSLFTLLGRCRYHEGGAWGYWAKIRSPTKREQEFFIRKISDWGKSSGDGGKTSKAQVRRRKCWRCQSRVVHTSCPALQACQFYRCMTQVYICKFLGHLCWDTRQVTQFRREAESATLWLTICITASARQAARYISHKTSNKFNIQQLSQMAFAILWVTLCIVVTQNQISQVTQVRRKLWKFLIKLLF